MEQIFIGIDPGINKNTGVGIYNKTQEAWDLERSGEYSPVKTLQLIRTYLPSVHDGKCDLQIYIEDTSQLQMLYSRNSQSLRNKLNDLQCLCDTQKGSLDEIHAGFQRVSSEILQSLKRAINIGMNGGTSRILADILEFDFHLPVYRLIPSAGGLTKLSAEDFQAYFGVETLKSKQNLRDAMSLLDPFVEKDSALFPLTVSNPNHPRLKEIQRAAMRGYISAKNKQNKESKRRC